jgi:hypothetical protein
MAFPDQFSSHNLPHGSVNYHRAPGFCAVHDLAPSDHPQGEVARPESNVAICRRDVHRANDPATPTTTAVYQVGDNGPLGAPTGTLFIRLADDAKLTDLKDALAEIGLEVLRWSPGAGNSGWIKARSGSIEEAIHRIPQLSSLKEVQVVEPEMLMVRQKKAKK